MKIATNWGEEEQLQKKLNMLFKSYSCYNFNNHRFSHGNNVGACRK